MANTFMQKVIEKVDVSEVVNGIDELNRWGNFAAQAGIIPTGTTIPQAMAIIQTGKEIGLQPMQSLRSMNFIKGRLTMSVQLQLALAKQRGVKIVEMVEEENYCRITLERSGETITCSYSLEDAKKAGLIKPDGNYDKYLKQMLRWRATGDCLRLIAPDLVMGLLSPEEAENIEPFSPAPAPIIKETKKITSEAKQHRQEMTKAIENMPYDGKPVVGIADVTMVHGEKNGKSWTKYHIKTTDGSDWTTFDKKLAEIAKEAKEEDRPVIITTETKGKYINIIGIERMPDPDFSDPEKTDKYDTEIPADFPINL